MKWRRPSDPAGLVERLLIAVAAALCIYAAWVWVGRSTDQTDPAAVLEPADESTPAAAQPPPRMAAALQQINRRAMFSASRREGFDAQVVGILGDRVYFSNDQSAGVGDSVAGATVMAIGPDWVEIEFDGARQRLPVFVERRDGGGGSSESRAGRGRGRGGSDSPMRRFQRRGD